jgi:hypothetical protein
MFIFFNIIEIIENIDISEKFLINIIEFFYSNEYSIHLGINNIKYLPKKYVTVYENIIKYFHFKPLRI